MSSFDVTKVLFITATTTSSLLSGGIASISVLALPSLLRAPSDQVILNEWHYIRARAATFAPPLALLSASCSFLTAYLTHSPLTLTRSYKLVAAGLTTLAIVPFRFLGMQETGLELMEREERSLNASGEGEKEISEAEARGGQGTTQTIDMVRWWGTMNLVRAALPLIGTLLAFEAL